MARVRGIWATVGALVVVVLIACLPTIARAVAAASLKLGPDMGTGEERILGLVEGGRFHPLVPRLALGDQVRLTEIGMQVAQAPESAELDLRAYEGRAVVVQGRDSGGWVYSARVTREMAPLASGLVRIAGWW